MNVLIAAIGTSGDVHPFIGLGAALGQRGHRVVFLANEYFRDAVVNSGLSFVPVAGRQAYDAAIADTDLWRADSKGMRVFTRGILDPPIEPVYDYILSHADDHGVVIANIFAFGALCAGDKRQLRLVTAHISPTSFRSGIRPPRFAGMVFPRHTPPAIVRAVEWLVDKAVLDPGLTPTLNRFRTSQGLAPARRVLNRWIHSPQKTIGLFPSWFCRPQPDWPPNAVLTGFPRFDRENRDGLPPNLVRFLAAGEPPVVFTPGSGIVRCRRFFEESLAACGRIHARALLLTRCGDQVPAPLPGWAMHADYVPLSALLPRCAALVHHGGIGTTAQGLAAGVPQLIKPILHDQPDNAHRVRSLCAGDVVSNAGYRAGVVTRKLSALLESGRVRDGCAAVARKFSGEDARERFCLEIERLCPDNRRGAP